MAEHVAELLWEMVLAQRGRAASCRDRGSDWRRFMEESQQVLSGSPLRCRNLIQVIPAFGSDFFLGSELVFPSTLPVEPSTQSQHCSAGGRLRGQMSPQRLEVDGRGDDTNCSVAPPGCMEVHSSSHGF
ncbi:unnamed protein product [Pleuronectes platessa]|uniref:Uncharacterized protein n=1 Tax=Pleuronectes platessa TaxID=8262 RepID=A0A9N7Y9F4_PLEPL|nr:unnamed protein product [Pleuronectes platessa]